MDVVLAVIGIVLLSPLLLILAVLIKREDGGPVFYRGLRVGLNGRTFRIFKFRTMVVGADKIGGPSTSDDDTRITRIGRFLRRHKLDELPQLVDILRGRMSFVGPRPQVPEYVARYTDEERVILTVRPGITDYASIRFHNEGEILRGYANPDRAYEELIHPEKIRLGCEYVRTKSLRTDLRILWMTARILSGFKPRSS